MLLMNPGVNLRYLHYLRLVIEQGSFEAAGRAAGVSQPAISHGLKQLEKQFAAPLLQRSGRRSVPTELALRVATQGAVLDAQLGALGVKTPGAKGKKAAPPQTDAALLHVGLTSSAALVCGPLLHDAWCGSRPGRRLLLSTADEGRLLAALQRRELDLVIAPRPRSHAAGVGAGAVAGTLASAAAGVVLYPIKPLAYARRSHPLRQARTLAELQHAAWVAVEPGVRGPVDVLSEAFAVRRMAPPRVVAGCADYASMLNLMLHADLLGVLPHPALLMGELHKQIVPLRLREAMPLYEMCLFQSVGLRRSVRPVVEWLSDAFHDC